MKQIKRILRAPKQGHWVGDGFPVRAVFAELAFTAEISPFLMLDYGGPMQFSPTQERRGVGMHPHRGFETVTMAFQGEVEHADSVGNRGIIGPGDVQWMTAASGILHEEMHSAAFASQGGTLEMVQLWVNLPAAVKMSAPRYQAISGSDTPLLPLPDASGTVRVVAGNWGGVKGPANTFTPVNLWDVALHAGKSACLSVPEGDTTLLFVRSGKLALHDGTVLGPADLALLTTEGGQIDLAAQQETQLILMSGLPIDEPIAARGPFVMNTEQEILQAMSDYQHGRMGQPAGNRPAP